MIHQSLLRMRSGQPACRVSNPQTITTTGDVTLDFDQLALLPTARYDDHYASMWSLASKSRVYAQRAGWYLAHAVYDWPDASTSDHRGLTIRKNGTGFVAQNRIIASSLSPCNYSCAGLVYMDIGDYVDAVVFKNTAGTAVPQYGALALTWVAPPDTDGVSVTRSTTQSVTTGSFPGVTFDTVETATGATMWTSGTDVTAPSDGWYLISGINGWDSTSGTNGRWLWIDTTSYGQISRTSSQAQTAGFLRQNVCAAVYLSASNVARLVVAQNSGVTRSTVAGARFVVVRIPNVTDAVFLSRTTLQTASSSPQAVQFTTEHRDDGGLFDSASNTRITIQRRGTYFIGGHCHSTGVTGSHRVVDVYENGANFLGYNSHPAPSAHNDPSPNAFCLGHFEAGRYVELRFNPGPSTTAGIQSARFQAIRIPEPA